MPGAFRGCCKKPLLSAKTQTLAGGGHERHSHQRPGYPGYQGLDTAASSVNIVLVASDLFDLRMEIEREQVAMAAA
jgi:hypothetical protein